MSFEVQKVADDWKPSEPTGSLLETFETKPSTALENSELIDPEVDPEVKEFTDTTTDNKSILEDNQDKKEPLVTDNKIVEIDDNLKNAINSLAEEGVLDLYENHEIKTLDDVKLLLKDNIEDKLSAINENIFEESLQSLPPQFQSVIKYGLSGGTDLTSLMQAWADVEKTYNTDISTDEGKEEVVREYLQRTNYGTKEMIEQDIQTWKDLGKLDSKAEMYKPKLEEYHMTRVAQQEQMAQHQAQQEQMYYQQYTDAVGQVLAQNELNGIPVDDSIRQYIYQNSMPVYQSQLTGEPIDALQAVVEELKFGEGADPSFYSELMLFATQPQLYKEKLMTQLRTEMAITKERTLRKKTQESISGTQQENVPRQPNRRNSSDEIKW